MSKITIVVNAAIFNGNKYLLTQRHDPQDRLVHKRWQMPGGGVNFKESLKDALQREMREEIGNQVEILEMIAHPYESITERQSWHGVVMTFLCRFKNQNAKIKLNGEASTYGWFSLKQMRKKKLHYGTYKQLSYADELRKGVGKRT